MKLKVIDRNVRHIRVNVFAEGALNGTLVFTPEEWTRTCLMLADVDEITIIKLNQPRCSVCERRKKPIGRDMAPQDHLCSHECEGYDKEPVPGTEWD